MQLSYYPGCSLHGTAVEYDESTRAVCAALDIGLSELEDWNCCGATSGHAVAGDLGLELSARNLAIAQKSGRDVVVPCAACFNRLRAAEVGSREGAPDKDLVSVRSLVDVLAAPEVRSRLAERVKRPLDTLAAVTYYGCLLVRPVEITGAKNPEDPQDMDAVLAAIGVDLKTWSYKTQCCGGGLTLSRADVVDRLVLKILDRARRSGAECIVTACPMCLMNLECKQFENLRSGAMQQSDTVPVLYLTELVGIALGISGVSKWLERHLMDPSRVLKSKGLV